MECMSPLNQDGLCEACGYDNHNIMQDNKSLKSETILANRYLVGNVKRTNGEGNMYIAFDTEDEIKVYIKEFIPGKIASRDVVTQAVIPFENSEVLYKSMLAEFIDNCRSLSLVHTSNILPLFEVFEQNNTAYAVYKYVKFICFDEFMGNIGKALNWNDVKRFFLPLCNSISHIHKSGIIHRGISPKTIVFDEKGKLWLTGFCLSEIRTAGSALECELYDGFSAPEQYSLSSWQGTWTDVYALGAFLYYVLTATLPPSFAERKAGGRYISPISINKSIPKNISDAIDAALAFSTQERTQSVEQFTAALLENSESNTAVYGRKFDNKPVIKIGETEPDYVLPVEKPKKNNTAIYVIIAMLFTVLLVAGLGIAFADELLSDLLKPASSSQTPKPADLNQLKYVPDFTGMNIAEIQKNAEYRQNFILDIREDYNEKYAKGVVFNQAPAPQTPMLNRGTVIIYVSKGSQTVLMPVLAGTTLSFATQTLKELEIPFVVEEVDDTTYPEGYVIQTSVLPSTSLIKNKDTVTLYVRRMGSASSSVISGGEASGSDSSSSDSGSSR